MIKTHNILTRGVSESHKRKLEKIAKKNRCSVNFIMLQAIFNYLENPVTTQRINPSASWNT